MASPVDYDAFLAWAESRFGDVRAANKEVKLKSIFTDDRKHHLYCCREKGIYHCFKSDQGGTLVKLVATVDGCSYAEAAEKIGGSAGGIRQLESRLHELVAQADNRPKSTMALPPATHRIVTLEADNPHRQTAEGYISSRHLPVGRLMVCVSGEYRDRVVIPYYGPAGELIYWNSRDLTGKAYLRYRGPKKDDVGVGKDDVLWFDGWPRAGTKVYLTEGEFDAMSLNVAGLAAGACGGKNVSEKQMGMLAACRVAISFDADKSGADALNKLGAVFERFADVKVTYVRPPTRYKDWNEMLIDAGPRVVRAYVEQNEKSFNGRWTANKLIFNSRLGA